MKISMSKTREQFPLSTKKVLKKTVSSTLAISILLLIIGIVIAVAIGIGGKGNFGILILAVLAVLVLIFVITTIAYIYQKWYYSVYFYDLTDNFIIIKKGPITPREINIPYERVQDVYVDQDLLDRIFGLYDVHLSSATISSGTEAHIDGVEKPAAEGLRGLLLQTVQQRISKNRQNINTQNINTNQINQQ